MPEFIDLQPGMRILVAPPGEPFSAAYEGTIRQVTPAGLRISKPRRNAEAFDAQPGQRLAMFVLVHGRTYRFATRVRLVDLPPSDGLVLDAPSEVERTERREFFRLDARITPRVVAVLDDHGDEVERVAAVILDLSGGGAQLQTETPLPVGARIRLAFELEGDPSAVEVVAEVRGHKAPRARRARSFRAHCQFTQIARADVERIVRFVHRQQRELRRKGVI